MPYNPTLVLQLPIPDSYSAQDNDLGGRLGRDQQLSSTLVAIDQWAASMTGSATYTIWQMPTGSTSNFLANDTGFLGAEYNRIGNRIITEVIAYAVNSGSGGVTTIDVLVQQGSNAPANFSTIFKSTNNADRLALSASAGNFGVAKQINFVSGANMVWPAGTMLQGRVITAAGNDVPAASQQRGLTVQVYWKTSGSYGV